MMHEYLIKFSILNVINMNYFHNNQFSIYLNFLLNIFIYYYPNREKQGNKMDI